MHKFIVFLLLIVLAAQLQAFQLEEEMALQALFRAKHAVNRAAHAAAQQLDPTRLAYGEAVIDRERAAEAALLYLRDNLGLDEALNPLPGRLLRHRAEVLALEVMNDAPFVYERPEYGYSVRADRPSVVLIVRIEYPRLYTVLPNIVWEIKSTAEIVYNG